MREVRGSKPRFSILGRGEHLTQRKDELLVELGGVREALEALHVSKLQRRGERACAPGRLVT